MAYENDQTTVQHPPGELAARYMRLARAGRSYRSKILRLIHKRPSLREPSIRSNKQWSLSQLHRLVGQNLSNLEAITLQIVGTHPSEPCDSCKKGQGPFTACISLQEDAGNVISACANCHWGENDGACDFHAPPAPDDQSWQPQRSKHTLEEILAEKDAEIAALRAENCQLLAFIDHVIIQHRQRYDWIRRKWNAAHELIHNDARYADLRRFIECKLEQCHLWG